MMRNFVALGAWGIRDNLGLELHLSFNGCARYGVRDSERGFCAPSLHPNDSPAEAAEVRRLGEYEYNRDRLRRAISWMAAHPRRSG